MSSVAHRIFITSELNSEFPHTLIGPWHLFSSLRSFIKDLSVFPIPLRPTKTLPSIPNALQLTIVVLVRRDTQHGLADFEDDIWPRLRHSPCRLWWRLFYDVLWSSRRGRWRWFHGRFSGWKPRCSWKGEIRSCMASSFALLLTYSKGNLWQRHPQTRHHKASPRRTTTSSRRRIQD